MIWCVGARARGCITGLQEGTSWGCERVRVCEVGGVDGAAAHTIVEGRLPGIQHLRGDRFASVLDGFLGSGWRDIAQVVSRRSVCPMRESRIHYGAPGRQSCS